MLILGPAWLAAIVESILITVLWLAAVFSSGLNNTALSMMLCFIVPLVALAVMVTVLCVVTLAKWREAKHPHLYGFIAAILVGFITYLAWDAYVSDFCRSTLCY